MDGSCIFGEILAVDMVFGIWVGRGYFGLSLREGSMLNEERDGWESAPLLRSFLVRS